MAEQLVRVASATPGPYWHFTFDKLVFEMPFTREVYKFGPAVPHFLTWGTSVLFLVTLFLASFIKPSKNVLKVLSFWHYVGLCLFSALAFLSTIYIMVDGNEIPDSGAFYCNKVPDWYQLLAILFLLSKYWEWVDTYIHIWQGKTLSQIGFLHLFHHATTTTVFAVSLNVSGGTKIGLLLNGFVHTLMYAHYAFRLPRFFRPIITIAQILQLAYGTYAWKTNLDTCVGFETFIEDNYATFLSVYATIPVYLFFFVRFFWHTYIAPPAPTTSPTKTTKAD